jgi:hypothetical protein
VMEITNGRERRIDGEGEVENGHRWHPAGEEGIQGEGGLPSSVLTIASAFVT